MLFRRESSRRLRAGLLGRREQGWWWWWARQAGRQGRAATRAGMRRRVAYYRCNGGSVWWMYLGQCLVGLASSPQNLQLAAVEVIESNLLLLLRISHCIFIIHLVVTSTNTCSTPVGWTASCCCCHSPEPIDRSTLPSSRVFSREISILSNSPDPLYSPYISSVFPFPPVSSNSGRTAHLPAGRSPAHLAHLRARSVDASRESPSPAK